MGFLGQLGFMLWKNVVLKTRQPVILLFEVIWPLGIFLAIVMVRRELQPQKIHDCHYTPRVMPSTGALPFLQSFVCNMNNECHRSATAADQYGTSQGVSDFMKSMEPMLADVNETNEVLRSLPQTANVFAAVVSTIQQPQIQKIINLKVRMGDLVKNKEDMKQFLVNHSPGLSSPVVDSIFRAELNISKIYELSWYTDLRAVVCDHKKLQEFLMFTSEENARMVSQTLCALDDSVTPNITNKILSNINVSAILHIAAMMQDALGEVTLADSFRDMGSMFSLIAENSTILARLLANSPDLQLYTSWMNNLVQFTQKYGQSTLTDLQQLSGLMQDSEKLVGELFGAGSMRDFNHVLTFVHNTTKWMSDVLKAIPDLPVLHSDIEGSTMVSYVGHVLNMTSSAIFHLSSGRMDLGKAQEFYEAMSSPQTDYHKLFCVDPGYDSMFIMDTAAQNEALQNFKSSLCNLNQTALFMDLAKAFDGQKLNYYMAQLQQKAQFASKFDWTEAVKTGSDLVAQFQDLASKISPLLDTVGRMDVSLQSMWKALVDTANIMFGQGKKPSDIYRQLSPIVGVADQWLLKQEWWSAFETRGQVVAQSMLLDSYVVMTNLSSVALPYIRDLLKTNFDAVEIGQAFIIHGPDMALQLVAIFTDYDMIKEILGGKKEQGKACNATWLKDQFLITDPKLLEAVQDLTCKKADMLHSVYKTVWKDLQLDAINKQLSDMVQVMTYKKDATGSEWDEWAGLSKQITLGLEAASIVSPPVHDTTTEILRSLGVPQDRVSQYQMTISNELVSQHLIAYIFYDGMDKWISDLELFMFGMSDSTMDAIKRQIAYQEASLRFGNRLYLKWAEKGVVDLYEEIPSKEVRKLLRSNEKSPEIMELLLFNSLQFLINPSKLQQLIGSQFNIGSLCSNLTSFKRVLAPPRADFDLAGVQAQLCGSVMVNYTLMYEELLEGMPGLRDLMQQFDSLFMKRDTVDFSPSRLVREYERSMAIQAMLYKTRFEWMKNTSLSSFDWLSTLWKKYAPEFEKHFASMTTATGFQQIGQQVMQSLAPILETSPEMAASIASSNQVMEQMIAVLQPYVSEKKSVHELLADHPQMARLSSVVRHMPILYNVFLTTVLNDSTKAASLYQWRLGELCNQTISNTFVVPRRLADPFRDAWTSVCRLDVSDLGKEMTDLIHGLMPNTTHPAQTQTLLQRYAENSVKLQELISQLWTNSSSSIFNSFYPEEWLKLFTSLGTQLADNSWVSMMNRQFMEMLKLVMGAPEYAQYMSIVYDTLTMVETSLKAQNDPFYTWRNSTEAMKAVEILDYLPEISEILFLSMMAPQKANFTVNMLMNPRVLCSTPGLQQQLHVPENYTDIFWKFQETWCNLNWDKLFKDLEAANNQQYAFITALAMGNYTARPVDAGALDAKISQVQSLITSSNSLPMTPRWLDFNRWTGVFMRVSEASTNLQQQILTGNMEGSGPAINDALRQYGMLGYLHLWDYSVSQILGKYESLNGKANVTLVELFGDSEEIPKLIKLLQHTPEIMEIYNGKPKYYSLAFTPALNMLEVLCQPSASWHDYFSLMPGSHADLGVIKEKVCAIDFNKLIQEASHLLLLNTTFTNELMSRTETVNLTMLYKKHERLIKYISTVQIVLEGPWGQDTAWNRMLAVQSAAYTNLGFIMEANMGIGYLFNFMNSAWPIQNGYRAIIKMMHSHLDSFGDNGTLTLQSLFPESEELRKLVTLLDPAPDLIQMFLASSAKPRFQELFHDFNKTLLLLCDPTRDVSDYLTVPPGSQLDLNNFRTQFCQLDFTKLQTQIESQLQLGNIIKEFQSVKNPNTSALMFDYSRLYERLVRLVRTPERWALPAQWYDGAAWQRVLQTAQQSSMSNPTFSNSTYGAVIASLIPTLRSTPQLAAMFSSNQEFIHHVWSKLELASKPGITLEKLLNGSSELHKLATVGLHHGPEITEFLLYGLNGNPTKVQWLLGQPDVMATLCSYTADSLRTEFNLPAHLNVSSVLTQLCSINQPLLAQQATVFFGIDKLLSPSNSTGQFDWNQFAKKAVQYPDLVTAAMKGLENMTAAFNSEQLLEVLMRYSQSANIQDVTKLMPWTYQMLGMLGLGSELGDYYRAYKIYMDFGNDILSNLKPLDGKIDLMDLVKDSKNLKRILGMFVHLESDVLAGLMASSIKYEKMAGLSGDQWNEVLCSTEKMREYFIFPASLNVTQLTTQLCGVDVTALWPELQKEFNLGQLMSALMPMANSSSPLNMTMFMESYNRLVSSIESLLNVTDVKVGGVRLAQLVGAQGPYDPTQWSKHFDNIAKQWTSMNATQMGAMLSLYMSPLESTPYWSMMRPYYDAVNIISQALRDNLPTAPGQRVTLNTVLQDATKLRQYLEKTFMLAPDLVATVLYARVDPFQVLKAQNNSMDIVSLLCSGSLWMPESVNSSQVKAHLCATNYTHLEQDIRKLLNWDELIKQVSGNGVAPGGRFNWTEYLQNYMYLQSQLGWLLSSPTTVPEFFHYTGNFTSWLQRLEQSLVTPSLTYEQVMKLVRQSMAAAQQFTPPWLQTPLIQQLHKISTMTADILIKMLRPMADGVVDMETLFGGAEQLQTLLRHTLGLNSTMVTVLSQSTINVTQLSKLMGADEKTIHKMLCEEPLEKLMTIPKAWSQDVASVQRKLCGLNTTALIDELWGKLDISRLIQEMTNIWNLPTAPDPAYNWLKGVNSSDILNNLISQIIQSPPTVSKDTQQLFNMSKFIPVFTRMFSGPMATMYPAMVGEMSARMCPSMMAMADNAGLGQPMTMMFTMQEMLMDMVTKLPDMEDLTCQMNQMNLTTMYYKVSSMLKDMNLQKLLKPLNGTYSESCATVQTANKKLTSMLANSGDMVQRLTKMAGCMMNTSQSTIPAFTQIDRMIAMVSEGRNLIKNMPDLQSLSPLMPVLDSMLQSMNQQQSIQAKLSELLEEKDLAKVLDKLMPDIAEVLMQSYINLSKVWPLLNMTTANWERILCNSTSLGSLIMTPSPWKLNTTALSQHLCGGNFSQTMKYLQEHILKPGMLEKVRNLTMSNPGSVLAQTLASFTALMQDIGQVPALTSLLSGSNLTALLELGPQLQELFVDQGPLSKMLTHLEKFLEGMRKMSNDDIMTEVISDLEMIVRALKGLKVFSKYMPATVRLDQLLNEPEQLYDYLVKNLRLPPEVAQTVLKAGLAPKMFVGASSHNISGMVCDPHKLSSLVMLPGNTSVTMETISRELCQLGKESLSDLMDKISRQLNIGSLIQQFISLSPDKMMDMANLTKPEVEKVSQSLPKIRKLLMPAVQTFTNLSNTLDVKALSAASTGKQTAMAGLESLSEAVCGQPFALKVPDEYGLLDDQDKQRRRRRSAPEEKWSDLQISEIADVHSMGDQDKRQRRRRAVPETKWSDQQMSEIAELRSMGQFCVDLYKLMHESNTAGKIVWPFLKPLLMGKIPFTPDTPVTRAIMNEAVGMFREVETLQQLTRNMADSLDQSTKLLNLSSQVEQLKAALQNPLVGSAFSQYIGVDLGELVRDLEALRALDGTSTGDLATVVRLLHNVSRCMEPHRLEGFPNERELVQRARDLKTFNKLFAGVVFMNIDELRVKNPNSGGNVTIPSHVMYKIRMDVDQAPVTDRLRQLVFKLGPEDNFADEMRYLRGFIQLQDMIDQAIIKLHSPTGFRPNINIKQIPYPCHERDDFLLSLGLYFLPVVMCLAWLVLIGTSIRSLVLDKELGIEEALKAMGLNGCVLWLSWFLVTIIMMLLVSLAVTLFLKLGNLTKLSDPVIIWIFLADFSLSVTMFCYLIGALFGRVTMATLCGMIVYLISYLPFVVFSTQEKHMSMLASILSCLSTTTAFSFGSQVMVSYELRGEGLQWSNIDEYLPDHKYSFTLCLYMMLADAAIYGLVAWYIRNVFPGRFGVAQPWYFPLSPAYWGCWKPSMPRKYRHLFTQYGAGQYQAELPGLGEKDPDSLPLGILLHKLRKRYGRGMAVNNLTVNVYQDQITALLGANGAGKTTTIGMLTGMFAPSSGAGFINGMDIYSQGTQIRRSLGLCPQHNILIHHLTVFNHLEMIIKLKGGSLNSKAMEELGHILHLTGLRSVMHVQVSHLSGGQQRRLCVAMAFAGGPKVVILDEPTSGVDSYARRKIWDLISHYKKDRTVLMSTHHLDEAEVMADRVVIMHKGNLVCTGSPLFLKTEYGSGYQLSVEKLSPNEQPAAGVTPEGSDSSRLLSLIETHIPGACLRQETVSEMTFSLPAGSNHLPAYPELFRELESQQQQFGIASFGVSTAALEEVFLKLVRCSEDGLAINASSLKTLPSECEKDIADCGDQGASATDMSWSRPQESGCGAKLSQLAGLLTKRFHHHRRDLRMYLSSIILPCAFIALALVCAKLKPENTDKPSLMLTPAMYGPDQAMFYRADDGFNRSSAMIDSLRHGAGVGTACMASTFHEYNCTSTPVRYGVRAGQEAVSSLPECSCDSVVLSCPDDSHNIRAPYSTTPAGALLYNLSTVNMELHDYLIRTNKPFVKKRYGGWSLDSKQTATVWFNNKGWHALPAFYNGLSNMILRGNLQHNRSQYGISTYSHPLPLTQAQLSRTSLLQSVADSGISLTLVCAFCFVPAGFAIFLISERAKHEDILQRICGVGRSLYWFASFIWDMITYEVIVGLAVLMILLFQIPSFTARDNLKAVFVTIQLFGWATIPLTYLLSRCFKETTGGYLVLFTLNLFIGITTTATVFMLSLFLYHPRVKATYDIVEKVFLVLPQFCLGNSLVKLAHNQLVTDILAQFDIDGYKDPFTYKMIGWELVAMAAQGAVFLFLLALSTWCSSCSCSSRRGMRVEYEEDEDVARERERVTSGAARGNSILTLDGLTKIYKSKAREVKAVDKLSIGISESECFGLLGINGAGKSTTFNMMTGETAPSSGATYFMKNRVHKNQTDFDQQLGYCQQIDALDELLTGTETLHFYAKLRGMDSSETPKVCITLLRMFGLLEYADKLVKTYSGGTKRKLSMAIAVLARPTLTLLDEPTTGMDPRTRRRVWNVIKDLVQDNNAVVLTSHSMAECEALCTRLAIMVNGRLMCLGSVQHLKSRFGRGYSLTLKVPSNSRNAVVDFIQQSLPGTVLRDSHVNMVAFEAEGPSVSQIFAALEEGRSKGMFEDYMVMQASLDQVFQWFARMQGDGTEEEEDVDDDDITVWSSGASEPNAYDNPSFSDKPHSAHLNGDHVVVQLTSKDSLNKL